MSGKLVFITGPMNGGKTTELLLRLRRYEVAEKSVFLVRPETDIRAPNGMVKSKSGGQRKAIAAPTLKKAWEIICKQTNRRSGLVIGIDEVQFFEEFTLADDVMDLVWQGNVVITAGLIQKYNMSSEHCLDVFQSAASLYAQAHEVIKMTAVCIKCKEENAVYSYRHGYYPKCSSLQGETEIGDNEIYSSLCITCYADAIKENKEKATK